MSLVGPRPHPVDDYERYDLEHLRRLDVKPGITGLWQVKARRDPSFHKAMTLDLDYIENWSLRKDLGILFKTIPAVLRRRAIRSEIDEWECISPMFVPGVRNKDPQAAGKDSADRMLIGMPHSCGAIVSGYCERALTEQAALATGKG